MADSIVSPLAAGARSESSTPRALSPASSSTPSPVVGLAQPVLTEPSPTGMAKLEEFAGALWTQQPRPAAGPVRRSAREPANELSPEFDSHDIIDMVFAAVTQTVAHEISAANAVTVITTAMLAAERVKSASGVQKKEVVMAVVERLVGEIDDPGGRAAVAAAVQALAPSIIDAVVAAASGRIDLGKAVALGRQWLPCC